MHFISSINEILLVIFGFYILGIYLSFMVLGIIEYFDDEDGVVWFIAVFWPISWIIVGTCVICFCIEDWSNKHRNATRKLKKMFFWATLPFNPYYIGMAIRKIFKTKCKKQT